MGWPTSPFQPRTRRRQPTCIRYPSARTPPSSRRRTHLHTRVRLWSARVPKERARLDRVHVRLFRQAGSGHQRLLHVHGWGQGARIPSAHADRIRGKYSRVRKADYRGCPYKMNTSGEVTDPETVQALKSVVLALAQAIVAH
jgi:hypothetical protein